MSLVRRVEQEILTIYEHPFIPESKEVSKDYEDTSARRGCQWPKVGQFEHQYE